MKLEYDKESNAAYIYLVYPIPDGAVKKTVELSATIFLDFDSKGRILGIEILDAKKVLDKKVLLQAAAGQ